ncbi:MAG: DUF4292 domain-containing protein [Cytophagales bacterium]
MMIKKKGLILLCLISILFTDCARRKILKVDTNIGKVKIKRKFRSQNAEFQYLNCKSKIEFTDGLQNVNSNATIRISKDSVIWVSVPVMGVEVVRCLINQDSLFIINKLQKEYYMYSFKQLSELLNFKVTYPLIQSILFGNPPFAEVDADSTDSDSVFTTLRQNRQNVSIENFVRNQNNKLERLYLRDELTSNTLDINYEDFLPLEHILFAFSNKISLNYRDKKGMHNIYIGIQHNKIEPTNKDLRFPFNIPNKFERK